ncbi:hypothetical protein T4B_10944 [Trichinella pseudospiralis]|uniref:Uncharacterized protein n=1 Tax=Trichinella pseudospiralis TaxID=6337 RepID=A0A0V1GBI6_TRIPS|nr:hypothetical protein T4B_10944 [Trichinella pseudospiralis]KRY99618.1 hypothetical protein T4C_5042 [Trichinella pseudospiralis]
MIYYKTELKHSIEWDKETIEFNKSRGILHLFFMMNEQEKLIFKMAACNLKIVHDRTSSG